jgi:Cu-Zn family superoxide dismutase
MKLLSLKKFTLVSLCLLMFAFFSCNSSESTEKSAETDSTAVSADNAMQNAEANITGTYSDTTVDGKATFMEENGKVKMVLNLTVPSKANQSVAVHLHEHGACGDMGKEAHGHWNPTNKNHGKWGTGEFHSGDIGNVQLDADGKGSLTMETDLWSIGGDSTTNILDKSIIVHGGVDDYTSQPSGNAGTRIGCGVIRKS